MICYTQLWDVSGQIKLDSLSLQYSVQHFLTVSSEYHSSKLFSESRIYQNILQNKVFDYVQCTQCNVSSSAVLPCRPAKGSLMSPPTGPAAARPGRVATVAVGKVSTASPPWLPTEPATLRGIRRGWPRDPCWAIMPVIRVARPSWVRTLMAKWWYKQGILKTLTPSDQPSVMVYKSMI